MLFFFVFLFFMGRRCFGKGKEGVATSPAILVSYSFDFSLIPFSENVIQVMGCWK